MGGGVVSTPQEFVAWSDVKDTPVARILKMDEEKFNAMKGEDGNVSMAAWMTKIDTVDVNSEKLMRFKLAVAQGMGIDVDKILNEDSLKEFNAKMAYNEIGLAIDALQEIALGNSIDAEQQQDIANAVAMGGMKFHSLVFWFSAY